MCLPGECRLFNAADFCHDLLPLAHVRVVQWDDQTAPNGQLSQKGFGYERRSTGDQDAVKRCKNRLSFKAISVVAMRPVAHLLEKGRGGVVKGFLPFYAVDLVAHRGQYCTLISASRAYFKDVCSFGQAEQFCLFGDRERVADCLASTDAKGFVVVGKVDEGIVHEVMARHPIHGVEHGLIGNAHGPEFAQQFSAKALVAVAVCEVGGGGGHELTKIPNVASVFDVEIVPCQHEARWKSTG